MVFLLFLLIENVEHLERASVSFLMLSAKQGNHWYHLLTNVGMPRPLSGIEPWTLQTSHLKHNTKLNNNLLALKLQDNNGRLISLLKSSFLKLFFSMKLQSKLSCMTLFNTCTTTRRDMSSYLQSMTSRIYPGESRYPNGTEKTQQLNIQ